MRAFEVILKMVARSLTALIRDDVVSVDLDAFSDSNSVRDLCKA